VDEYIGADCVAGKVGYVGVGHVPEYVGVGHVPEWMSKLMLAVPE
jgi:hypothetical protein